MFFLAFLAPVFIFFVLCPTLPPLHFLDAAISLPPLPSQTYTFWTILPTGLAAIIRDISFHLSGRLSFLLKLCLVHLLPRLLLVQRLCDDNFQPSCVLSPSVQQQSAEASCFHLLQDRTSNGGSSVSLRDNFVSSNIWMLSLKRNFLSSLPLAVLIVLRLIRPSKLMKLMKHDEVESFIWLRWSQAYALFGLL